MSLSAHFSATTCSDLPPLSYQVHESWLFALHLLPVINWWFSAAAWRTAPIKYVDHSYTHMTQKVIVTLEVMGCLQTCLASYWFTKADLRTCTIGLICKGSLLINTDTPISDRTPLDLCFSLLITWPRLYAQDVRNLLLVLRSITLWWVSFLILKFVWEVACSWHCPTAERFFSMHNVSTGSSGFPPLSEMARHPIHYPRIREKCAFHFAKI